MIPGLVAAVIVFAGLYALAFWEVRRLGQEFAAYRKKAEAERDTYGEERQRLLQELKSLRAGVRDYEFGAGAKIKRLEVQLNESRAQLTAVKQPFPVVDMPEAPIWEQRHADGLKAFLSTDTGRQLRDGLNYHEQACNRTAVLRTEGFENNCGFARGWSKATEYLLHTLTADVPENSREDDDPASDPESLGVHSRSQAAQPGHS